MSENKEEKLTGVFTGITEELIKSNHIIGQQRVRIADLEATIKGRRPVGCGDGDTYVVSGMPVDTARVECMAKRIAELDAELEEWRFTNKVDELQRRCAELEAKLAMPVVNQELAAQAAAPDGWQMVPIEPTEEMISAGDVHMDGVSQLGDAWANMLASAPVAPAPTAEKSAKPAVDTGFKNFHLSLCERFGYTHDERNWMRDQLSLIEHIASAQGMAECDNGKFGAGGYCNACPALLAAAPALVSGQELTTKAKDLTEARRIIAQQQAHIAEHQKTVDRLVADYNLMQRQRDELIARIGEPVALTDEQIDSAWNSLPGIEIHNRAAKIGQDTNCALRIAFARAIIAAVKGGAK